MSAVREDTRDELGRFQAAYAALEPDAVPAAQEAEDAAEYGAEWMPEETDDDAAAFLDDERDDDDQEYRAEDAADDEPQDRATAEEEPAPLGKVKRELNAAKSELGRLRPMAQEVERLRPLVQGYQARENAHAEAAQNYQALANEAVAELRGLYEQAAQAATTEVDQQRWRYAAELLELKYEKKRDKLATDAKEKLDQAGQRTAQDYQRQQVEQTFRTTALPKLQEEVAALVKEHHLSKAEADRLWERANSPALRRVLQSAPLNEMAQTLLELRDDLADRAKALGKGRARENRERAVEERTYRREEAAPARAGRGKPTIESIQAKYRNSGDMQGMYAEMMRHGLI